MELYTGCKSGSKEISEITHSFSKLESIIKLCNMYSQDEISKTIKKNVDVEKTEPHLNLFFFFFFFKFNFIYTG